MMTLKDGTVLSDEQVKEVLAIIQKEKGKNSFDYVTESYEEYAIHKDGIASITNSFGHSMEKIYQEISELYDDAIHAEIEEVEGNIERNCVEEVLRNHGIHIGSNYVIQDMTNIKDSMQLDSGTLIGKAIFDKPHVASATVEVRGEIRVVWCGEAYRTPSEFPDDLKELIEKIDDWYMDSRVYMDCGNWFEVFLWDEEGNYLESDVVDIDGSTYDQIYDMISDYAEEYEKGLEEIEENEGLDER